VHVASRGEAIPGEITLIVRRRRIATYGMLQPVVVLLRMLIKGCLRFCWGMSCNGVGTLAIVIVVVVNIFELFREMLVLGELQEIERLLQVFTVRLGTVLCRRPLAAGMVPVQFTHSSYLITITHFLNLSSQYSTSAAGFLLPDDLTDHSKHILRVWFTHFDAPSLKSLQYKSLYYLHYQYAP
jgi:hypothetical protein